MSWLPVSTSDVKWLVGVNGTYVIKPPDATVNGSADLSTTPGGTARNSITLSDPPELTVDSNGYTLANTAALNASHLSQWGVETALQWGSLYGQAGYYGFNVARTPVAWRRCEDIRVAGLEAVNVKLHAVSYGGFAIAIIISMHIIFMQPILVKHIFE